MMTLRHTRKVSRVGTGALAAIALFSLPACDLLAPPTAEEQFEQAIGEDSDFSAMYDVMKEEFPDDYARFRDEMVALLETSDNPRDGFNTARDFMLGFIAANAADFRAAPTPVLLETRDANIALMEMLAEQDDRLCGNFAMRGLQFGDEPVGEAKEQLGRVTAMQLSTIAAGRKNPTQRSEPTQGDVDALIAALERQGMSKDEVDTFLMGTLPFQGLPPVEECRLGVTVYGALADVPDDASARLSAIMLLPTN